jgi:hypothetical protein
MDPRIGWHPNELLSEAYSTWTNVWMIAQINTTTQASVNSPLMNNANAAHSQSCNVNTNNPSTEEVVAGGNSEVAINENDNNTNTSYDKLITLLENAICSCNSNASAANLNQLEHTAGNCQSNFSANNNINNSSTTSQTILNGLKSRKLNKASTFGFNFPINQHILGNH